MNLWKYVGKRYDKNMVCRETNSPALQDTGTRLTILPALVGDLNFAVIGPLIVKAKVFSFHRLLLPFCKFF